MAEHPDHQNTPDDDWMPLSHRVARDACVGARAANPGLHPVVDAVALRLHANRSLHQHNIGVAVEGACAECWLSAWIAVEAVRLGGFLGPQLIGQELPWHTVNIRGGSAHTEVEHPAACACLPPGAVCWYEHDRRRFWMELPHGTPGLYRLRPETRTDPDGDHGGQETVLAIQAQNPEGRWQPWHEPDEPPYAWAAWTPDGGGVGAGTHTPGLNAWNSLGIGDHDPELQLEPLTQEELLLLEEFIDTLENPRLPGTRAAFEQYAKDRRTAGEGRHRG